MSEHSKAAIIAVEERIARVKSRMPQYALK
jgi:hypothetical protein